MQLSSYQVGYGSDINDRFIFIIAYPDLTSLLHFDSTRWSRWCRGIREMSLFCGCLDASKCKPQSHPQEPAINFNIKARLGTCPLSRLAALCKSVSLCVMWNSLHFMSLQMKNSHQLLRGENLILLPGGIDEMNLTDGESKDCSLNPQNRCSLHAVFRNCRGYPTGHDRPQGLCEDLH